MIYMEKFNTKVMAQFDNNAIPDYRRRVASTLIDSRDNGDASLEKLMEEQLVKPKKK